MKEINNILSRIDNIQKQIESYGKIDADVSKRIQYKFRLDWNYYSNEMEGNSLTRMETKQLMMDNVTIDGKPFKDISEMRGHDTEVREILKIGKGEVRISENRIKGMHQAIMYEDNPEKRSLIGKWKTTDNHIINFRGEKFNFLPHHEVAEAMHDLLNKTNAEIDAFYRKKNQVKHPVLIALEFHLRYLEIHPFYDGNGRTGRLLMNLLLISFGYPPIILKKKSREQYYKLLAEVQGYGADPDDFYVFLCKLLLESQHLILDAIEGRGIEDEDDLDKEILLWKSSLDDEENDLVEKNDFLIADLYKKSLRSLFELFLEKHKQFDELFFSKKIENQMNDRYKTVSGLEYIEKWVEFKDREREIEIKYSDDEARRVAGVLEERYLNPDFNEPLKKMKLRIDFSGFKKSKNPFDCYSEIIIRFDQYKYGVEENGGVDRRYEKFYTTSYSEKEMKEIVEEKVRGFLETLKTRVK